MSMVYRLNANELNSQFMDALQILFKDKEIEIIVNEVKEIEIIVNEVDETAYLFKSEANRQELLQAIQNIEAQQNLVQVTLDRPA